MQEVIVAQENLNTHFLKKLTLVELLLFAKYPSGNWQTV